MQKQIIELEYDINDALKDIVNDFMGITSVGDAIEDMVGKIIDALRSGEDAMGTFNESIDDMIANMVKKVYSEKILDSWFKDVWGKVNDDVVNRTSEYQNDLSRLEQWWERFQSNLETNPTNAFSMAKLDLLLDEDWMNKYGIFSSSNIGDYYKKIKDYLLEAIRNGSKVTLDDIKSYAEMLRAGEPVLKEGLQDLDNTLTQLGLMKDVSNNSLSNLQQGIQSLSEDTGNAIESYLNGISQQIYLHSSQLEEIKALMQGWDFDVSLGTMSQILLQLQSSYQVQMTIQNTLLGWSSPNGMSVRVEMV